MNKRIAPLLFFGIVMSNQGFGLPPIPQSSVGIQFEKVLKMLLHFRKPHYVYLIFELSGKMMTVRLQMGEDLRSGPLRNYHGKMREPSCSGNQLYVQQIRALFL